MNLRERMLETARVLQRDQRGDHITDGEVTMAINTVDALVSFSREMRMGLLESWSIQRRLRLQDIRNGRKSL